MMKRLILALFLLTLPVLAQQSIAPAKPETVALPDTDRQVIVLASQRVSLSECQRDLEDLRDMNWHLSKAK